LISIFLSQPGNKLCGAERIAAKIREEVIIDGNFFFQAQHRAKGLFHSSFKRIPRRCYIAVRPASLAAETRESIPVDFSACTDRNLSQEIEARGNHVGRQRSAQCSFQIIERRR